MKTYETYTQYLTDCTDKTVNSYVPPAVPYFWVCADCGKAAPHNENFARTSCDNMICYRCAHARDVAKLRDRSKPFSAYVSCNGQSITNWPGETLGKVFNYDEHSTGWYGSTQARFRVRDVHGQWWTGRGAGRGMYCTLRPMKTPKGA